MASPIRYSDGVTNAAAGGLFGQFPMLVPTKMISLFEDFLPYTAADWVKTATSAGAGTSAAAQSDTGIGGAVIITTAANEDDSLWLQRSHDGGTNDLEAIQFAVGKKAWFECKFQGNEAEQQDFILGIHKVATDPIDTAPTDGIWFQMDDGDENIDLHIVKNSIYTTASAIGTISDDTNVILGFYWDGVDTIHYFVDDIEKGTLSSGTLPDDEYMTLSFGTQNGAAAAKTMTTDFLGIWMER